MKKIIMDYCLLHQMNTFGPKNFDFHAWVKKCHSGNFSEFSKINFIVYILTGGIYKSATSSINI